MRLHEESRRREDLLLPLLLFILTIITRVPFTSKLLYHSDSVHFALALEKYDITVHQPHPPGYFLYVMLGRILNYFIRDANNVFVCISILFSGLTVASIYYLGKEFYDRKTGVISAAIALTSPNLWFHGEVALTYIVEAFFSAAIALISWRIYKGEHKYIWLSVIALGIAGGIRQNTMVFLLPLWLFSVRRVQIKKILLSLGLLGFVCLIWFLPMVYMTGGWNAYREAFRELWLFNTGGLSVYKMGWSSFKIFSLLVFFFTAFGIGSGILILLLVFYSLIRHGRLKFLDRTKVLFFSLWVIPSISFYLFIFIFPTNPGYVLIFLPTLFILIGASIGYMSTELRQVMKKDISAILALAIIIFNTGIFFLSNYPVSYREIKTHDQDISIMLASIKTFDPLKTAIFVGPYTFFGYRHIMYYLPEYRVYQVDVRVAPSGEARKTFWGLNKETFLSDEVIMPENITNFISIHIGDDINKVTRIERLSIKKLEPTEIYIVSGNILFIKNIYPNLKIRFQNNNKDNKYEL